MNSMLPSLFLYLYNPDKRNNYNLVTSFKWSTLANQRIWWPKKEKNYLAWGSFHGLAIVISNTGGKYQVS